MQDDEFLNPGMQWVEAGKEMFNGLEGKDAKTCASCHGKNGSQLDPKRIAQYPVYNERLGKPVTLQGQIRACWSGRLGYHPLPYDTEGAVKLEAFVHNLARGEKVNVQTDGPMKPLKTPAKRYGEIPCLRGKPMALPLTVFGMAKSKVYTVPSMSVIACSVPVRCRPAMTITWPWKST
jgi:sulfur-oxidizing protein SoxA